MPIQQGGLNVKKPLFLATIVAIVLSLAVVNDATAQQPQRPPVAPAVAILDLTYIFKHHARFKQMSEAMRPDVDAAENGLKADREADQKLMQRLEEYKRGSPEYKQLEEDLR